MPDKDHKAALKAWELKAGTTTVHEMPVAMHSTANGPQLEWHIEFCKSLVAFKHTLMTPDNWWTLETYHSALIPQQKN